MIDVTINAYAFEVQFRNLLNLAVAIKGIGNRVAGLTSGLPAPIRDQVADKIEAEIEAIRCTCHCLGELALAQADDAEEWKMAAEKEGIQMSCRLGTE